MEFGNKLQSLRRQSGLSQEQLASQLGVSRQAVSKWELNEAMPDTENVLQLSRLFGVSCDYLLIPEMDVPGPSAAPGEAHLTEQGWTHNAAVLSLAACAVGFLLVFGGWFHAANDSVLLIIGLIVQILGPVLFELAAPRMGRGRAAARLRFYMAANWLLIPVLALWLSVFAGSPIYWPAFLLCDLLLCGAVTAILTAVLKKCFPDS